MLKLVVMLNHVGEPAITNNSPTIVMVTMMAHVLASAWEGNKMQLTIGHNHGNDPPLGIELARYRAYTCISSISFRLISIGCPFLLICHESILPEYLFMNSKELDVLRPCIPGSLHVLRHLYQNGFSAENLRQALLCQGSRPQSDRVWCKHRV